MNSRKNEFGRLWYPDRRGVGADPTEMDWREEGKWDRRLEVGVVGGCIVRAKANRHWRYE